MEELFLKLTYGVVKGIKSEFKPYQSPCFRPELIIKTCSNICNLWKDIFLGNGDYLRSSRHGRSEVTNGIRRNVFVLHERTNLFVVGSRGLEAVISDYKSCRNQQLSSISKFEEISSAGRQAVLDMLSGIDGHKNLVFLFATHTDFILIINSVKDEGPQAYIRVSLGFLLVRGWGGAASDTTAIYTLQVHLCAEMSVTSLAVHRVK